MAQAGGSGRNADPAGGARAGATEHYLDRHFRDWRERQIAALDRDYQDYCSDRQKRFEREFSGWRDSRPHQQAEQQAQAQPDDQAKASAETAGGGGALSAAEASIGSSASDAGGRTRRGRAGR